MLCPNCSGELSSPRYFGERCDESGYTDYGWAYSCLGECGLEFDGDELDRMLVPSLGDGAGTQEYPAPIFDEVA